MIEERQEKELNEGAELGRWWRLGRRIRGGEYSGVGGGNAIVVEEGGTTSASANNNAH
eukprot:CAMPEP_0201986174 /NCGR_PEP_ID=MMETSP0904-20121228/89625_1 /ASSEMBLY_ACC=CAM_ASM_000553 /TAXON_ID=420261 /ORGANISM="Thalassiosira antarctica, Strain CCMP982" /LENGTH=57 /DNA_ID=CAMNT_0048540065 /DNA_START=191 /DNA_END=364 /DNA_ORIENTATION=+